MFLVIKGIDHLRLVGISKFDNKAYDFDIINKRGYRHPLNSEEIEECQKVAKEYYNSCIDRVRVGEFLVESFH